MYFINLVNEIIFNNNAKILQYSTEKSFNQNNQIFFEKIIKSVDQIYFVDDFIQSGNTFLRVHNFVRQSDKNIKGLICMLNKTDRFGQATIKQYLPTINEIYHAFFPFHDVNVKAVKAKTCAMCIEKELYLALAEESVLDAIKISFLKRARKLQHDKKGTNNNPREDYKKNLFVSLELFRSSEHISYNNFWNNQVCSFLEKNHKIVNKHYIKFLCRHFLNKYISEINETEDEKEYLHINKIQTKIIKDCHRVLKIQVNKKNPENYLEVSEKEEISNEEFICKYIETIIDELVIKVLIQPEFKNYITIRKNTAEYVTKKLIDLEATLGKYFKDLENLNLNENKTIFNYHDIDYIIKGYYLLKQFKFYLRRSVLLQMNFCIHEQTLIKLKRFYFDFEIFRSHIKSPISELISLNGKEKDSLKSKLLKEILYNLSTFNYYYVSLVKELIHYEPIKAIRVEKTIRKIKTQINSETSLQYGRLIDLISYENTGIFNKGIINISEEFTNIISKGNHIYTFSKAAKGILSILIEKYKTKDASRDLSYFFEFIEFDDSISSTNDYRGLKNIHIYTLRTIYLYVLLNSREQFEFPRLIKAVTRNLQRIVCDTTTDVEEFKKFLKGEIKNFNKVHHSMDEFVTATIRSKNHNRELKDPLDLKMVGVSYNGHESRITQRIKEKSINFISMKGLSKINYSIRTHTDVIPENTIVKYKIEKSNSKKSLKCLQGTLFQSNYDPALPNLNWEELQEKEFYIPKYSILTFKINSVKLESKKKLLLTTGDYRYPINIYPQAIFVMSSLNDEFIHERVRLMLTLRASLSYFFRDTFESNAYAELLQGEENKIVWERENHSINHFIRYIRSSLHKIKNSYQEVSNETFDCLEIILYATKRGTHLFKKSNHLVKKDELKRITQELFLNIHEITGKTKKTIPKNYKIESNIDFRSYFILDKFQIGFILFELIYNMIKHYHGSLNDLNPKLTINKNHFNNYYEVTLKHIYFNNDKSIELAIDSANDETERKGTDMLRNYLTKMHDQNNLKYSFDGKEFTAKIILYDKTNKLK